MFSLLRRGEDGRTPRVYVSCLCRHEHGDCEKTAKDDKLHQHVMHALQHDFYVKSGPCGAGLATKASPEDPHAAWEEVQEADVCVFVLDDPSLNTVSCFRSLCAAWACDLPTLFLKDSGYSLPTPLPEFILQQNLGLESPTSSRTSSPTPPSAPPFRRSVTPETIQMAAKLAASFVPPGRPLSATSLHSHRRHKRRSKQELRDSDMVMHLLNGYRDALVFDDGRHEECEVRLRGAVHNLLGTKPKHEGCDPHRAPVAPKSPNTLHPLAKRHAGSSGVRLHRRRNNNLLGVPGVVAGSPVRQDPAHLDYDDDDDDDLTSHLSYPSEVSIHIASSPVTPHKPRHLSASSSQLLSPSGQLFPHSPTPSAASHSGSPPLSPAHTLQVSSPLLISPATLSPISPYPACTSSTSSGYASGRCVFAF
jgi:hypothetical protein